MRTVICLLMSGVWGEAQNGNLIETLQQPRVSVYPMHRHLHEQRLYDRTPGRCIALTGDEAHTIQMMQIPHEHTYSWELLRSSMKTAWVSTETSDMSWMGVRPGPESVFPIFSKTIAMEVKLWWNEQMHVHRSTYSTLYSHSGSVFQRRPATIRLAIPGRCPSASDWAVGWCSCSREHSDSRLASVLLGLEPYTVCLGGALREPKTLDLGLKRILYLKYH